MIELSKKMEEIFKSLYESERVNLGYEISFSDIMKSNVSRLEFLTKLLNDIEDNAVSFDTKQLIEDNIDFINSFLHGDYSKGIAVPKKYVYDMDKNSIVPRDKDLDYLFTLIETNVDIFNYIYSDNDIILRLPDKSFNMNMERILQIKKKNLAHLMGLTESELGNKDNFLKKYFLDNVRNREKYGESVSEQLLNWILSSEGKSEIKRLNQITLDFIKEDKKYNKESYDKNGNIKDVGKFKKKFKEKTSLDYPIIKFSRYMTKCINNINFMNLFNTNQVILDYNVPINSKENDEKDIFVVNSPISKLCKDVEDYKYFIDFINNFLSHYEDYDGKDEKLISLIEKIKSSISKADNDNCIKNYINLIKSYDFVGKHGINPNQDAAIDKINSFLDDYFSNNIHFIGFGTSFETDQNGEIKTFDLDEWSVNYSHCDTSLSIKMPDLINKYYKRGRAFFIDKIYSCKGGNLMRLSNPQEELKYLKIQCLMGEDKNDLVKLESAIRNYKKAYSEYKSYVHDLGKFR